MNNLMIKLTRTIITLAVLACLTVFSFAQGPPANKNGSVKGQMKESGKEVGKAGKSLGSNVKHGRVARGGKKFGKHMYKAGKHFGKGSGRAAKKTGKVIKNAAKP